MVTGDAAVGRSWPGETCPGSVPTHPPGFAFRGRRGRIVPALRANFGSRRVGPRGMLARMQRQKQGKARKDDQLDKGDLIVIGGAGGFIGGSLARYFHDKGFTRIRAVDKKPLPEWYQCLPGVESIALDLSQEED